MRGRANGAGSKNPGRRGKPIRFRHTEVASGVSLPCSDDVCCSYLIILFFCVLSSNDTLKHNVSMLVDLYGRGIYNEFMARPIRLPPSLNLDEVRGLELNATQMQLKKLAVVRLALDRRHQASEIARIVGISRQHFFTWMHILNEEGLSSLLRQRHGGGRKTAIQGQILAGLRKRLAGKQSASEVQIWLRPKGITITKHGVYFWKRKLGFTRSHHASGAQKTQEVNPSREDPLIIRLEDLEAWQHESDVTPFLSVGTKLDAIIYLHERTCLLEKSNSRPVELRAEIKNIASTLECSVKSLYRWADRFREVNGDLKRFAATSITSELWKPGVFEDLKAAFESGEAGTGSKAVQWLKGREPGIEISLRTAYRWLEKCGKSRTPRDEKDRDEYIAE